jgi:hypothetical protein
LRRDLLDCFSIWSGSLFTCMFRARCARIQSERFEIEWPRSSSRPETQPLFEKIPNRNRSEGIFLFFPLSSTPDVRSVMGRQTEDGIRQLSTLA